MNRSLRFLMGLGTLAILIPALILVSPGVFGGIFPGGAQDGVEITPNALAADTGQGPPQASTGANLTCSDSDCAGSEADPAASSAGTDPSPSTHDHATTATPGTEASTSGSEGQDDHDDHQGTHGGTQATTPSAASGTITGAACPCTVTSTAELKGEVSLKGDLMVMGGTLVARPGVTVNGNGFQIMFMDGGKADFQGSKTSTWSGNGSNANVKRDITFRNLRRIMFHEGAGKSILKYFAILDSGTSTKGDYSLHFHMNGNTTRGTLVEGVAIVGSKHHAFVPHASHGITFRDTIAINGRCEAYWWDPPEFQSQSKVNNSNDIIYDHALADGVRNCPGDDRGWRLSAFNLGAGSGNTVRNSVARNVNPSHAKNCSGFFWPELHHRQPSSWTFQNNASYGSECNGIFVWQNDSETHIVNGFAGDGIEHGAYGNRYDYRNVDVEFVVAHATGWSVTGGSIDRVVTQRHQFDGPVTFSKVAIGNFVVDNASNDGNKPATYILNGTGLACGDIQYKTVVPGTRVVIDGADC